MDEPEASVRNGGPQPAAVGLSSGSRGHGAKSDAARERAVLALLSARTIGEAAKRSSVGERTLRRWLTEDAAFKAEYDAARRSTFDVAMHRLQSLTSAAVDTLEDLLKAKKFPAVRLGAARTVADLAIHQRDAEQILARLDELEAARREGSSRRR